jgi:hypothetical protein
MTDTDIWHPLGEKTWRELSDGTGASELQLKFAACRFGGASATKAAKLAGYSGDNDSIRRAGYTATRSTAVQALLELASVAAPGESRITDREIDAKLARLIRSADPNVVIKAAELHAKREGARKDAGEVQEEELSPKLALEREARGLLGCDMGGTLGVAAMYLGIITKYGPRLSFAALPLFKELAPSIKAEWAEVWQRILGSLDRECAAEAEQFAQGPLADIASLMEIPGEKTRAEA